MSSFRRRHLGKQNELRPSIMADVPGLSRPVLTEIQNSCYGVDHLQIEEIMFDWTPAEARGEALAQVPARGLRARRVKGSAG